LGINNLKSNLKFIVMKKILTITAAITLFLTSCTKGDLELSGSVGVQIGPVEVVLSWGGTGLSGTYYGGLPSYGTEYFVGYIGAKPIDGNNIPILTKNGLFICTASCTATYWQDANEFYNIARSVTYPPLRPVLIRVQWNTMTNAPHDFYIVGY